MAGKGQAGVLVYLVIEEVIRLYLWSSIVVTVYLLKRRERKRARGTNRRMYNLLERIPDQVRHLSRLVHVSDTDCLANLRMDMNCFGKLCQIFKGLGLLADSKYISVEQQLDMFLGVLSHHKKVRITGFDFMRSGKTVSHYLHVVLLAILRINHVFIGEPTPVGDDCTDPRWRSFKGCIGALDGTYFHVTVPTIDKPRFRNRKGQIVTNTLACCDLNLQFTYLLPGWEGSAADGHVLRDAILRPNGLKVPQGTYYLCDSGYANSEGFLTPYKGVRYHLKEWGPDAAQPTTPVELFNMRHTKARNVIEQAFGILKMRWGILRSPSFYSLKTQIRLIMSCFLLHNFIRREMADDPFEIMLDALENEVEEDAAPNTSLPRIFIDAVEGSPGWNAFRDELSVKMWEEYHE